MLRSNVKLELRVNNKPITEYTASNNIFVEGRTGKDYTLHIENRNSFRILAVVSIDGLSIMDGELATENSNGYVVSAHATLDVPGWRLTDQQVAKFKFGLKENSYATKTGKGGNNGVIGLIAYKEKELPNTVVIRDYLRLVPTYPGVPCPWIDPFNPWTQPRRHPYYSEPAIWSCTAQANACNNIQLMNSSSTIGSSVGSLSSTENVSAQASAEAAAQQTNTVCNLGTEFGSAAEFATTSTQFNRGVKLCEISIFYDTVKGLKARGVIIEKPVKMAPLPQAFAGGCTPPSDWLAAD